MNQIFVNVSGHHFKAWTYLVETEQDKTRVITYSGKIGLPLDELQKHPREFEKSDEVTEYIHNKIREKKYKKYRTMPADVYFGTIDNREPILNLVKKIEEYSCEA